MNTNVLQYLEETVKRVPDKMAFADVNGSMSFQEMYDASRSVGSYLIQKSACAEPVVIFMKKSPQTLAAFFGAIYAGCIYVPIDEEMPERRMQLILENTQAKYMICDSDTADKAGSLTFQGSIISFDEAVKCPQNDKALEQIREHAQDMDAIYILFTSGSTGVPKGVVGHHRGVIDYIESLSETLEFGSDNVFGNQTPFYLDACMKEVYPTLKYGAATWIIPKELFMQPVKLVEFLNEHHINTICWVVSAMTIISAFNTFEVVKPEYLKTIAFGSEVFPIRQFNMWKKTLPEAKFYNLYGPTEATGMSCYYPVTRLFNEDEVIPIGHPFRNTVVFLLTEDGRVASDGEEGEICIKGSCLTHGYYRNETKTQEVFTQNPLNSNYPERIYHTGDIGKWNEEGQLVFVSRKDHQIKHMGHRIELGEIEADVAQISEIRSCCCIYMRDSGRIVLFYSGEMEKRELTKRLKEKLPRYMLPNAIMQLSQLPVLPNGKMDRLQMEKIYTEQKIVSSDL